MSVRAFYLGKTNIRIRDIVNYSAVSNAKVVSCHFVNEMKITPDSHNTDDEILGELSERWRVGVSVYHLTSTSTFF